MSHWVHLWSEPVVQVVFAAVQLKMLWQGVHTRLLVVVHGVLSYCPDTQSVAQVAQLLWPPDAVKVPNGHTVQLPEPAVA